MDLIYTAADFAMALGLVFAGAARAAASSILTPKDIGVHPGLTYPERCVVGGMGMFMRHGTRRQHRMLLGVATKQLVKLTLTQFTDAIIKPEGPSPVPCYSFQLKQNNSSTHKQVVILYFHGGAMVEGDACMFARNMVLLLYALRDRGIAARILALEYGLAPEHPFPAAINQARVLTEWVLQQTTLTTTSDEAAASPQAPIVLMGDSAGGNLVMTTLIQLSGAATFPDNVPGQDGNHTSGQVDGLPVGSAKGQLSEGRQLAAALLICPWLDLSLDAQAYIADRRRSNASAPAHVYPCTGNSCDDTSGSAAVTATPLAGGKNTEQTATSAAATPNNTSGNSHLHGNGTTACTCLATQHVREKRDFVSTRFLVNATDEYLQGQSQALKGLTAVPKSLWNSYFNPNSSFHLPISPLQKHPLVSPALASDQQLSAALSLLSHGVHIWVGNDEVLQPDITKFADRLQSILSTHTKGASSSGYTTADPSIKVKVEPNITVHAHPGGLHNYPLLPGKHEAQHTQHIASVVHDAVEEWYQAQ